jgi:predicted O-linked N-acetylglucosamine transferase (SPINDLY family)
MASKNCDPLAALEANPESPDRWLCLLESLLACGRHEEALSTLALGERHGLAGPAVEIFRSRLTEAVALPEERALLALMQEGAWSDASIKARRLIERCPWRGLAFKVQGALLWMRGQTDEALAVMQESVRLLPQDAEAYCNLGLSLARSDRFEQAEACLRRAIEIDPTFAIAHYRLGSTYILQSRLAEALDCLRRGISLRADYTEGDDAANYSDYLFLLSHDPGTTADELIAEHRRFGEYFEDRGSWLHHRNTRDPERRLKVGFVSGDLRHHAVADFVEPLFERLQDGSGRDRSDRARSGFEVHAYYTNPVEDHVSQRIKGRVHRWHSVAGLSNARLAQAINDEAIDILVDLSGHTALNRLLAFARKPAPVQVSTLGYPGTSGLQAMDYFLTDSHALPPQRFDRFFTENIVRIPAQAPFMPHATAPAVGALPALGGSGMTFGSFNRPDKLNAPTIELWSRLLNQLPASRMLVGGIRLEAKREELRHLFSACGVEAARVRILPPCDMDSYLALHHAVDLCLDTLPYNGGTTTLHALWMGVPTLTVAGNTPAGRSGVAILCSLGLHEFVTQSADDFVAVGKLWSARLPELAHIRAGARRRWQSASSWSPAVFAEEIETAFRRMWRHWCAGGHAESFR